MAAPKMARDIRDYLVNTSLITPVTVGFLAATPVIQYAVIEYPGPPNIKVHGAVPGIALDQGNVQVMARHTTAQTALTNIMSVVDALDGLSNTTINSVVYTFISQKGRPRIIERSEDGSIIYVAEFALECRR